MITNVPCQFISGLAGSGKSYSVKKLVEENKRNGVLTASTGIASVNIGGVTLASKLKFYNTASLRKQSEDGSLLWKIRKIADFYKNLIVDEASMLDGEQLDILVEVISQCNFRFGTKLGIIIVADLLQLPPVEGKFIFQSKYWGEFERNRTHLIKIWRQTNPEFINMINLVRAGKKCESIKAIKDLNIPFLTQEDKSFDGTTLKGTNEKVDEFNKRRLNELKTPMIRVSPIRRGTQLKEWDKYIPIEIRLKDKSYVMILANDTTNFKYANGDCGHILEYNPIGDYFLIRLVRNNEVVKIKKILRKNLVDDKPNASFSSSMFFPYFDEMEEKYVVGTINYHPLRSAYASTIHRAQGLSLDKVQIDYSSWNMGQPGMIYTAISRCKDSTGLFLVGNSELLRNKINTDKRVLKWV